MGDDDLNLDWDDDDEIEDSADEYDRRIEMCAKKIIACFEAISKELDCHEAWQLFEQFARVTRTKFQLKRKKGAHDPDFNTALLAAYDAAPEGKKTAKTNAVGAAYKKTPDTTQKHLRRLLKARKQFQQAMATWAKTIADK